MSLQSYTGVNVPLNNFGPKMRGSKNQLRCCIGNNYIDPGMCKWYGIYNKETGEKVPFSKFTLCSFCGENAFSADEVYPISEHEMQKFCQDYEKNNVCLGPLRFQCDMNASSRHLQKEYNLLSRKVTVKNGMQLNVNLLNPTNSNEWCSTHVPNAEDAKAAQKNGCHIASIPSCCGWEMILKLDPDGMYGESNYCFQIKEIRDGAGRKVSITDGTGRSDFYTPFGGEMPVRGYETGKTGEKFFFVAPTQNQKVSGDIADHHGESSKFDITVTIHKKVPRKQVYRGLSKDTDERYRGFGATRSFGATRGYNGGTNFSGGGYNGNVNTTYVDADFHYVDEVKMALQLVNMEADEELEYSSQLLKTAEADAKVEYIQTLKMNRDNLLSKFKSNKKHKTEQFETEMKNMQEQFDKDFARAEREIEKAEQEFGMVKPDSDPSDSFVVIN